MLQLEINLAVQFGFIFQPDRVATEETTNPLTAAEVLLIGGNS